MNLSMRASNLTNWTMNIRRPLSRPAHHAHLPCLIAALAIISVNGYVNNRQATVKNSQNLVSASRLTRSKYSGREIRPLRLAPPQDFNPFTSLLGDMASSVFGKTLESSSSSPQVKEALKLLDTPSWALIGSKLHEAQTAEERAFRGNLLYGYGNEGSPLHLVRLYDESNREEEIEVTFYRDSASWCPYCQKVWMSLEEKRIPYRVEKINMSCYGSKPQSFLQLQPSGQIPVARIKGRTYGQSNDILYALEEHFPQAQPLVPKDRMDEMQRLLRLERSIFSTWLSWLTSASDPSGRRARFVESLEQVERALATSSRSGPYFMGKDVTTVDFQFMPFLERMCASLLFFKGFMIRVPPNSSSETNEYPHINQWFDAMETRPSYQFTKSDYYTHCWDLPPQLGGCASTATAELYQKAINGKQSLHDPTNASWELSLAPHNGGIEPDWSWCNNDDNKEGFAQREATERLAMNHEAIVSFAARGAGRPGMPPVMAPLADPNASSSDAVKDGIDVLLRVICGALLDGTERYHDDLIAIARTIQQAADEDYAQGVVDSLAYLRDRVGVPRDMRLPAARQLRAHLNWAIAALLEK